METSSASRELEQSLEQHRRELTGYCYRMLGSPFEAEDAVQETFVRAWRGFDRFEGRASLRSWLYRIATNVCLDMLDGRERRARPMDLGPAREPIEANLNTLPEVTWIQPMPGRSRPRSPPRGETTRLALVAALQHLPPRQRAVLILCEVLRWKAERGRGAARDERRVGEQRAPAGARDARGERPRPSATRRARSTRPTRELLERYVEAFERYDMEALTSLIQEDATQSMPPFDLWLRGRDDIFTWWWGPGIGCKGSRVIPTRSANGSPAFGQYKPSESGSGYDPWALQVLEVEDGADRRAHVLPRHRDAVPALRAAAAARRLADRAGRRRAP